tara:strand:- start:4796 stop:5179 length:384 start_codon:yes stop_codon:yes gene_type:complete
MHFSHDCDPTRDLFSEREKVEKFVSVRYTHPVLDYIFESNSYIHCDAPDEVDAYNNPLYASIYNWFIPSSMWKEFQCVCRHMTRNERDELSYERLKNIEDEKKEFIKSELLRFRQLGESVDQTGRCT